MLSALGKVQEILSAWKVVDKHALGFCDELQAWYPDEDDLSSIINDACTDVYNLRPARAEEEEHGANAGEVNEGANQAERSNRASPSEGTSKAGPVNKSPEEVVEVNLSTGEPKKEGSCLKLNVVESNQVSAEKIVRLVQGYVAEIETLKKEFKNVEKRRLLYALRKHHVEKKRRRGWRVSVRLDLQLSESKRKYFALLDAILMRINSTHEKYKVMFRAVFAAFWILQRLQLEETRVCFNKAISFVNRNEDSIFADLCCRNSQDQP